MGLQPHTHYSPPSPDHPAVLQLTAESDDGHAVMCDMEQAAILFELSPPQADTAALFGSGDSGTAHIIVQQTDVNISHENKAVLSPMGVPVHVNSSSKATAGGVTESSCYDVPVMLPDSVVVGSSDAISHDDSLDELGDFCPWNLDVHKEAPVDPDLQADLEAATAHNAAAAAAAATQLRNAGSVTGSHLVSLVDLCGGGQGGSCNDHDQSDVGGVDAPLRGNSSRPPHSFRGGHRALRVNTPGSGEGSGDECWVVGDGLAVAGSGVGATGRAQAELAATRQLLQECHEQLNSCRYSQH